MFIQTEATPNPATMKFIPGRRVLESGTRDFRDAAEAERISPLARALFEIEGVTGVFLGADFVTVSKADEYDWQHMKAPILYTLMDYFVSETPVLKDVDGEQDEDPEEYAQADAEVVRTIKELLETRIRPAVAQDGGDIVFRGYREGVVFLHMRGACAGCPSSTVTLKNGIENLLCHFIPEVQEVRAV